MERGELAGCHQIKKNHRTNGILKAQLANSQNAQKHDGVKCIHKVNDDHDIQAAPLVNGDVQNIGPQNGVCAAESLIGSTAESKKWFILPPLVPTISRNEVPLLFREPHVEHGFRALNQPWSYYVFSVFQLHNESMNVWTHLLAFSLMTYKLVNFSNEVDFFSDEYTWPLLAGLLCGIMLYAFSSAAHCLQSKSSLIHYTAFMVDYAGIGLYGLGSIIVHLCYCSEPVFYDAVQSFFVPLGSILAFLICFCCTMAKVIYTRPYPFTRKIWQMGPVASIYIVLVSPIVHRLWSCYMYDLDCNEGIYYHKQQVIWFIISGIFFASDVPQRWKPGFCDHFFHSHQLFHMAIMTCTLHQMDGVLIDFQSRSHMLRSRPKPTFYSAFGPVISVLVAEFICIVVFTVIVNRKLKADLEGKSE